MRKKLTEAQILQAAEYLLNAEIDSFINYAESRNDFNPDILDVLPPNFNAGISDNADQINVSTTPSIDVSHIMDDR